MMPDQFTCNNGQKIFSEMVCDNQDDCGDNSDEQVCGMYITVSPKTNFIFLYKFYIW